MSALDRTFRISLIIKGIDGVLELIGGILLLLISPAQIGALTRFLTQHELAEDPHDFVATHLNSLAAGLDVSGSIFASVYLLLHGLVKVVLVWAVLKDRLWAYPWMIAFLLVFIGYQGYQLVVGPAIGLAVLTAFDVFIVWLTVVEYRKRHVRVSDRRRFARSPSPAGQEGDG